MTIKEARKIVKDFQERNNPSEDERFLFIEAMNFIIEEEKDPSNTTHLHLHSLKERVASCRRYPLV